MSVSRFGCSMSSVTTRHNRRPASRTAAHHSRRGSVLVPVVAAMLILLMVSFALVETFAAQRHQDVLHLEQTRAFWLAEAGVWNAAFEGTAFPTDVSFAGGTYTVAQSGDEYTATAVWDDARFSATELYLPAPPIDVLRSVATAVATSTKNWTVSVVSNSARSLEIAFLNLSDDSGSDIAMDFWLDGVHIWDGGSNGIAIPTGARALNKGSAAERTISTGASPSLLFEAKDAPSGTIVYTLILHFTDLRRSTMTFTIPW